MDLLFRPLANHLNEDWLRKSVPMSTADLAIAHLIRDHENKYFNLDNFKIGLPLAFTFFFSSMGILLLAFLINEATHRIRSGGMETDSGGRRRRVGMMRRIFLVASSFGITRLSAIGFFVLFVQMFLWFSELFLTNNKTNIKTNKVVRETGLH